MPFDDLSKDELIRILELVEISQKCKSPASVKSLILASKDVLEAEFAVCGFTTRGPQPVVSDFVNGNYPEEWVRRYTEENLCLHDPVVRFHSKYMLTQFWSDVFVFYDYPQANALISDARDYGLKFGMTGAVYAPERDEVALFTFASDRNRFKKHHKRLLEIMMTHFYNALSKSFIALPRVGEANSGKEVLGLTRI
ncbi:hypothetical protein BAC1_01768 [uncultured bacterium]|nr:hypothetical protein BAC1_01768 [uncultured bacterium]